MGENGRKDLEILLEILKITDRKQNGGAKQIGGIKQNGELQQTGGSKQNGRDNF